MILCWKKKAGVRSLKSISQIGYVLYLYTSLSHSPIHTQIGIDDFVCLISFFKVILILISSLIFSYRDVRRER